MNVRVQIVQSSSNTYIGIDSSLNTWFLEQRKATCSRRGRAGQQRLSMLVQCEQVAAHAGAVLESWAGGEMISCWGLGHCSTHTSRAQRQAGTSSYSHQPLMIHSDQIQDIALIWYWALGTALPKNILIS